MKKNQKHKFILKHFIAFLKKNNVYDKFLSNLEDGYYYRHSHRKSINEKQYIIETIKCNPHRLILDAFSWATDTKVNWDSLSCEWECEVWKIDKVFSLR
jgi:hypothetical protein